MHNMKKLILSVFIFTFGFATATHALQVNTLLTKQLPEVAWGNLAHFVEYTGAVTSLFPSSLTVSFAWAATVAETLFGILLIAGFKIRMASVLSGLLLL